MSKEKTEKNFYGTRKATSIIDDTNQIRQTNIISPNMF